MPGTRRRRGRCGPSVGRNAGTGPLRPSFGCRGTAAGGRRPTAHIGTDGRSSAARFPKSCRPTCPMPGRLQHAGVAGRAAAVSHEGTPPAGAPGRSFPNLGGRGAGGSLFGSAAAVGPGRVAAKRTARGLAFCLAERPRRRPAAGPKHFRADRGAAGGRRIAPGSPDRRGAAGCRTGRKRRAGFGGRPEECPGGG